MTLGLTNNENNFGVYNSQNTIPHLGISTSNYGTPIGTAVGTGSVANKSVGLVSDPTKSGIIVEADSELVVCIHY